MPEPDALQLPGSTDGRFHIHTTYQGRDGQVFADHRMDGQLPLAAATRQALNAHPHGQGESPSAACLWTSDESGRMLVLPAQAVQEVAAQVGDAVLAGVATCAKELGGHLVFWGL